MPGVTTILDELDTGHQTTLMISFDHEGWSFPEVHRDKYKLKPTENPFVFDPDNIDPSEHIPEDPRLIRTNLLSVGKSMFPILILRP